MAEVGFKRSLLATILALGFMSLTALITFILNILEKANIS